MMRGLQEQMSIGSMDELVYFRTPAPSSDGYGGTLYAVDDTQPTEYRARVTDLSAKEAPADSPQDKVTRLIRIMMRSLGSANPTHYSKVVWRTETYDIIDIHFTYRRRFMTIDARYIHTGT